MGHGGGQEEQLLRNSQLFPQPHYTQEMLLRKVGGRQGGMPQRMSWATALAVPQTHLPLLVKGDVCTAVGGFEACRL